MFAASPVALTLLDSRRDDLGGGGYGGPASDEEVPF
jgi:hypothetical protein